MLELVARWIPKHSDDRNDADRLPAPATENTKRSKPRQFRLPGTVTGFDIIDDNEHLQHPYTHWASDLSGSSNTSGLETSSTDSVDGRSLSSLSMGPWPTPPAVVRVSSRNPVGRSGSSSTPSHNPSSSSSTSPYLETPSTHSDNLTPEDTQSIKSSRPDPHLHITVSTDVYGSAYSYPLVKQLSPIQEQDYISPASARQSINLPIGSGRSGSNPSIASYISNTGSQGSETTTRRSTTSNPFVTRPLNRTASQTFSKTSSTSCSGPPPTIPPLNLAPPFPGPHPSTGDGNGPPLRPHRSVMGALPATPSSQGVPDNDELAAYDDHDLESLHAESFVTASEAELNGDMDISIHMPNVILPSTPSQASVNLRSQELPLISHTHSTGSSRAESRLESSSSRRRDRDASLESGVVTFRVRRQWIWSTRTPAFWTFWLGFICPFFWLVGGWHFTRLGEQPPRLTCWEFYFWPGLWRRILWRLGWCSAGKKMERKGVEPVGEVEGSTDTHPQARLPKWVAEKQSSDDGRMRLNDPKRSLRGISFGYPFVPRPVERTSGESDMWCGSVGKRVFSTLGRPNRFLDRLYGVLLKEVRGRPESGRRMFDPWIQRCRYAFCYAILLLCIVLCAVSVYLITRNTRQL